MLFRSMEIKAVIQAEWDKYNKKFEYAVRPFKYDNSVLIEERILQFDSPTEMKLRAEVYQIMMQRKQELHNKRGQ